MCMYQLEFVFTAITEILLPVLIHLFYSALNACCSALAFDQPSINSAFAVIITKAPFNKAHKPLSRSRMKSKGRFHHNTS